LRPLRDRAQAFQKGNQIDLNTLKMLRVRLLPPTRCRRRQSGKAGTFGVGVGSGAVAVSREAEGWVRVLASLQ